jgi:phosphoglycerate kinase
MKCLHMRDVALAGKRVLIREDLNVPLDGGYVTSDARIKSCLPTLRAARDAGARVMVISHLGRPDADAVARGDGAEYTLAPLAERLSKLLGQHVPLEVDWLGGLEVEPGQVVLCENVRLQPGEMDNDEDLARRMAALCDVFVMDAFGTAHRAQASTHGVARFAPVACAGPLLASELEVLEHAMEAPARPLTVIVGGAKVSSKLALLENLARLADTLIVGGGIANTFLAAAGQPVGNSLFEPDLVETARRIQQGVARQGGQILLPEDVVVADEVAETAQPGLRDVNQLQDRDMILDVGPRTRERVTAALEKAGTILWNGPLGVFELPAFAGGTRALAEAVAVSPAYSIAGGGETLAAIDAFGVANAVSYVSTGGGAFLEALEGKTLPAVAVLEERAGTSV